MKQENSTAGDDEVERERMDDELDLTMKNKHQTTNQVRKANQSYQVTRCAGNGKAVIWKLLIYKSGKWRFRGCNNRPVLFQAGRCTQRPKLALVFIFVFCCNLLRYVC